MSVLGTPTHLEECTFCDSTSIIDSVACLLVVKVVRVSPCTFTRVPNSVTTDTLFKSLFKTWVKTFTSTLLLPYSMFLVLNLGRRNIFFFRPMKNLICYIASWGIKTSLGTECGKKKASLSSLSQLRALFLCSYKQQIHKWKSWHVNSH